MKVIFQNPDDMRLLMSRGAVTTDEARLIRGSGVDPSWFVPSGRHAEGAPVVLLAARIIATKGIHEYVAAAQSLRSAGVSARFLIAGDFDRQSRRAISEADMAAWQGAGGVEYVGHHNDLRVLYAMTDVACLPSYRVEGLPKSLLEAASCALPIVATDVPGNREIVIDGENGVLVPVCDVPALAAALQRLINDPGLRSRMGRRGRERVIAEFSLERVVGETLSVYRELLG